MSRPYFRLPLKNPFKIEKFVLSIIRHPAVNILLHKTPLQTV